jgi:signal transduction histidine kinase
MSSSSLVFSPSNHETTHRANECVGMVGSRTKLEERTRKWGKMNWKCRTTEAPAAQPDALNESVRERTRIAQELHDTLLQGFFAVSMQLQGAVSELPADNPAKPRFTEALRLMERVLEEGRLAVQGLRSPEPPMPELGDAFASVPSELGLPSEAGFRVVVEGRQRTLRSGLRDEIYRIGREAIVNAYRHSRARNIETAIEYRAGELRIAIRDNGCGIDPQHLQWGRKGHWGLQGMRERAERIGARLRVLSRLALGTEVELCVPGQLAFEPADAGTC